MNTIKAFLPIIKEIFSIFKKGTEEFFKLWQSIIFRNIFICVEELNYIKDYMKVKITKIACKFAVKSD